MQRFRFTYLPLAFCVSACSSEPKQDSSSASAAGGSTSSAASSPATSGATSSSATMTSATTATDTNSTSGGTGGASSSSNGPSSTTTSTTSETTTTASGGATAEADSTSSTTGGGGSAGDPCGEGPYAASPLPDDASPQTICSGMTFTEGPVWIGSTLYFSDFRIDDTEANFVGDIVQYTPGGTCSVWLEGTGTNGLAIGPDGNLLGANHTTQTLTIYDLETKTATVLVEDFMGQKFSSPNDIAVRSDGNLYFTDPAHQLGDREEQLPQSVYRRSPQGELTVVEVLDDRRPNGVTLSPDEARLYVSASSPGEILIYDVDAEGATSAAGTLVNNGSDGMAIDCTGNLYLTSNGVQIYSPEGNSLGNINVGGFTTNVAFGGPEHRTLFITGGGTLYSLELEIPGLPY